MGSLEKANIDQLPSDLDLIQLHHDMNALHHEETTKEKLLRKLHENPLVPVGCLATAAALTVGLWGFEQGKTHLLQYMMRARVLAQGFTVIALVVGIGRSSTKATKSLP